MTACEVIEQIKALSPVEQAKVRHFVRQLEADQPSRRSANEPDFAAAATWTLAEHADLMRRLSQ